MKISEYFNFENFSPDLLDTAKVKMFLQLMKQKYISYWQHTLQHSQKLEFYRSFKNEYVTSIYLEITRRISDRRTLTKLRISNHKLMIELGRYNNTTGDNRLCPVCSHLRSRCLGSSRNAPSPTKFHGKHAGLRGFCASLVLASN